LIPLSLPPVWERVRIAFHKVEEARKLRVELQYLRKASETTATRQKTVDAKTQPQKPGKLSWDLETKTWGFA